MLPLWIYSAQLSFMNSENPEYYTLIELKAI